MFEKIIYVSVKFILSGHFLQQYNIKYMSDIFISDNHASIPQVFRLLDNYMYQWPCCGAPEMYYSPTPSPYYCLVASHDKHQQSLVLRNTKMYIYLQFPFLFQIGSTSTHTCNRLLPSVIFLENHF